LEWAERDSRVHVSLLAKCTVAQGRNQAISSTDAEIIVSTDMGTRLESDWLTELVRPLEESDAVMVVGGNYSPDPECQLSACAKAAVYAFGACQPVLDNRFLPSSRSIAYRRGVWEQLQGYPEDLSYAADDTVFALQMRAEEVKIAVAPKALVYWRRPSTIHGYLKESYAYSFGNGEAGILPAKVRSRVQRRFWRALIHAAAIRNGFRSCRAIFRALIDGEFLPAAMIPLLAYGYTLESYRGARAGLHRGATYCSDCRSRLGYHGAG